AGLAAAGPVPDVVDVGAAGVAAGEPAPVPVALAGRAAQRRGGPAVPAADVEQGAVVVVQHLADRRRAGDPLGGGGAERGAVFEVAAPRVGRVADVPVGTVRAAALLNLGRVAAGLAVGGRRFRGNADRLSLGAWVGVGGVEGFGADMDDDLVDVGIIGGGDLPGQVISRDPGQRVSQARSLGRVPLRALRRFRGNAGA